MVKSLQLCYSFAKIAVLCITVMTYFLYIPTAFAAHLLYSHRNVIENA